MQPIKHLLIMLFCLMAAHSVADQSRVQINWSNPDNYKDIKVSSGESKADFRQRLANNIQAHMDKLANDLPAGYVLEMTVTDLTLAGKLRRGGARTGYQEARVIGDGHRARMSFSYELLDTKGQPVKQGEENLKSPMSNTSLISRSESFRIEKKMLTRWFRNTVLK